MPAGYAQTPDPYRTAWIELSAVQIGPLRIRSGACDLTGRSGCDALSHRPGRGRFYLAETDAISATFVLDACRKGPLPAGARGPLI